MLPLWGSNYARVNRLSHAGRLLLFHSVGDWQRPRSWDIAETEDLANVVNERFVGQTAIIA